MMSTKNTWIIVWSIPATGKVIDRSEPMSHDEALAQASDFNRFSQDHAWNAVEAGIEKVA